MRRRASGGQSLPPLSKVWTQHACDKRHSGAIWPDSEPTLLMKMVRCSLQVTVRVRELLASPNPRHQAWAGAYLLLALGSPSEQAADQLWRWVCDSSFMDWVAEAFEAQHT